jgi:hypothetical protein
MTKKDDRRKAKRAEKRARAESREAAKRSRRGHVLHLPVRHYPQTDTIRVIDSQTGEELRVPLDELRDAPVRHETLPPDLLQKIRVLFKAVGRFVYDEAYTCQQWEEGFRHDNRPEREVKVWTRIMAAWAKYHGLYLGGKLGTYKFEHRLVGALVGISVQADELRVPPLVEQRLRDCWENPLPEEEDEQGGLPS